MVYGWLRAFVSETCPACAGPTERGFCAWCAAAFTRVEQPCARCGLAEPVARCPRTAGDWRVERVVAPLNYAPPLDHYIHALKYRGTRTLGRALALLIAPALLTVRAEVDALVAVPLHGRRLRERGYNQATELARTLARELELPLLERGIARRLATRTQIGQGAAARRASVAAAFAVRANLAGRRIAIVDDVVTTGATVNALAAALLAAGAARCFAWAVARAPEHAPQARNV